MSDRITQEWIDQEVRDHLATIMPLLERLEDGMGYVKCVDVYEHLTSMGESMLSATRTVARDSATYLYDDVLGDSRPSLG